MSLVFTGFLIILFVLLAKLYDHSYVYALDKKLSLAVYNYSDFTWIDRFYMIITHLVSGIMLTFLLLLLFIYFWVKQKKFLACLLAINLVGINLLIIGLKWVFKRDRPALQHMVEVTSYSFPSGHAMNVTAFMGFLCYVLWQNRMQYRYLFILFSGILVILVGFSRVYLGVHYPLDVIAGYVASLLWIFLLSVLYRRYAKE